MAIRFQRLLQDSTYHRTSGTNQTESPKGVQKELTEVNKALNKTTPNQPRKDTKRSEQGVVRQGQHTAARPREAPQK